jgi:hypothetical protein
MSVFYLLWPMTTREAFQMASFWDGWATSNKTAMTFACQRVPKESKVVGIVKIVPANDYIGAGRN